MLELFLFALYLSIFLYGLGHFFPQQPQRLVSATLWSACKSLRHKKRKKKN
jgi:hypothetical protein